MTRTNKSKKTRERPSGASAPTDRLPAELVEEIEDIAASTDCQIYHLEFRGGRLRIVLDREDDADGGVGIADCELVSKQVSALLDVVDFGTGRYTLEVSSPGLDRSLYRPRDYRRFVGSLAKITWRDPESGNKRTDVGRLVDVVGPAPGVVHLHVEERDLDLDIDLADVEAGQLVIEL